MTQEPYNNIFKGDPQTSSTTTSKGELDAENIITFQKDFFKRDFQINTQKFYCSKFMNSFVRRQPFYTTIYK